jgi:lipopolysaccharide transport system ATP-binding protein
MPKIAIEAREISKQYRLGEPPSLLRRISSAVHAEDESRTFWALRDVSFQIEEGQVLGVIGRNGAGKSTLLKILSRIVEPTQGRCEIHGRVGSLLEVGTGFHPELTGRENTYLNGAILGMRRSEIKARFDEIVAFAEVEQFIDTPVKRYSSGMYTRLAFAVAAHLTPEILIVDEVLAVGDAAFQQKCIGRMSDVAQQGRTVLLVSHNMAVIRSLCQSAVLLEKGRCITQGSPEDVIAGYLARHNQASARDEAGWVDVSTRASGAKAMMTRVRMIDDKGSTSAAIGMGSGVRFEVELAGFSDHPRAQIGLIVKSGTGQWLANINTGMKPAIVDGDRAARERVSFNMPAFPFVPGHYFVDFSIAEKGIGRLDYVENALQIEVIESDYYGSGYQQSSKDGVVYLDGEWRIAPA